MEDDGGGSGLGTLIWLAFKHHTWLELLYLYASVYVCIGRRRILEDVFGLAKLAIDCKWAGRSIKIAGSLGAPIFIGVSLALYGLAAFVFAGMFTAPFLAVEAWVLKEEGLFQPMKMAIEGAVVGGFTLLLCQGALEMSKKE